MFQIEQFSILHALGYAIGHSLWQMSLLWLLYFGAIHVAKLSSSRKYILAVSASLAGLLAFVATFIYYTNHLEIDSQNVSAFTMLKEVPAAVSSSENLLFIYNSLLATLRSLSPYLSCAYLVVMLVLSIRLVNGFGQVKQLRKNELSKPPVDWRLFVQQHARFLGIKKPVAVYISKLASSPLTIGFWKPIILIPLASINQLSPQQLEAVLLHELAHIRRHDYLLNIILQFAEIALFFNPFMRLLLKQARQERENSCDDWVLQFRYNAAEYARALLAIEKQSTQSLLALGSNSKNEFQLLNRVKRMIAPERQSFNYRQQLGLLFLITILGLGFTMIVPRQKEKNHIAQEEVNVEKAALTTTGKQTEAPLVVDLVKNLENIQKVSKVVASKEFQDKTKEIAEVAAHYTEKIIADNKLPLAKAELEKQSRALALAFESIPFKDFEFAGVNSDLLNAIPIQLHDQLVGLQWFKTLEPAVTKSTQDALTIRSQQQPGAFSIILPEELSQHREAEIAVKKQHRQQVLELERAGRQMAQVYRLSGEAKKIQDSMVLVQQKLREQVKTYEETIKRAHKEVAIAPFRVAEPGNNTARVNVKGNNNYHFNYSTNVAGWNEEDVAWKNENEGPRKVARAYTWNRNNPEENDEEGCKCIKKTKQNKQTTISINGVVLGEQIKKMINNVQSELGEEWTPELQEHLELELKKGLKELDKLRIKTQIVSGTGNSRAVVIEIESN